MREQSATVVNVSLVGNLSKLGPLYVADSDPEFFSFDSRMLFSSRVVVLTGMGNQETPLRKLQGPIPVAENVAYEGEYQTYLYQVKETNPLYSNLHLIICVFFRSEMEKEMKRLEGLLEGKLDELTSKLTFKGFENGGFDPTMTEFYIDLMKCYLAEIEDVISNSPPQNSLFNISYVATLEEPFQTLAKMLITRTGGIRYDELKEYSKEVQWFLAHRMIRVEEIDGVKIIKAR